MSYKNYYSILELRYDCTQNDIERAYHYYARIYHPEINSKTGNLYREIVNAYKILSDPIKREKYDLRYKIQSKAILEDLNEKAKFTTQIRDDIGERIEQLYNKYKNKYSNDEIVEKISNKVALAYEEIISSIKQFVFYRQKEDEFIKNNKEESADFPFDWFEDNQYFAIIDKQPIFDIIQNVDCYRFENVCSGIYNRSTFSIFFSCLVYILALPAVLISKIIRKPIFNFEKINNKNTPKWIKYYVYMIYKNNFCEILGSIIFLFGFMLVKVLNKILYSLYWIFDRILKVFILPFAYVFKWIILIFTIFWFLSK